MIEGQSGLSYETLNVVSMFFYCVYGKILAITVCLFVYMLVIMVSL